MKTYIGVKAVQAEPHKGPDFGAGNWGDSDGYRVRYADGYTSWSPKDVFEEAYVEVPEKAAGQIVGWSRQFVLDQALIANGERLVEAMCGDDESSYAAPV